ncbi:hypothetical protein [Nocardia rhizosphaerihabitans]|uniref:Excreted virulence factor EspC (Type VII ESX diderm) n=1 Tax=Nocardia rhizosphaerihabitans TaxID=1691570 RepID=A0ABQ2K8I4_9NOCA|nr:hypothetical protein [Nocardia rhizosphaerihabitans]GGN75146.1 hypothetical protein GCM10011610_19230 [Nocardia rhizosphaerihabitans]
MTGILQVDIDVLGKTVQLLRGTEQVLTDAMTALSKDGDSDIGTAKLNDAADNFQSKWKYGIERICESTTVTADGIAQCHTAYQQLDAAVAQALAQAGAQTDPQAVTPGTPK